VIPVYLWVLVVSTQLSGRAHRSHGQGGQGRAEAARRGSLDSPVTCSEQAEMSKPVRASCLHLLWSWLFSVRPVLSAPANAGVPAYLGARRLSGVGCKMAFGVSRRSSCGRSFLVGCPEGWQQQGCGSWSQIIDSMDAGTIRRVGSSGSFEGDLAHFPKRVVTAACQFAGNGDKRDVSVEPLAELLVVGVVG